MKQLRDMPGEHITAACARLIAEAPAWMEFNGVRVEAKGGETPADLVALWSAEMHRRRARYEASPEYKQHQEERAKRQAEETRIRGESRDLVERSGVRTKYPWTDAMHEISGFGGGYEAACRDMVYAGLAWLETRPNADLKARTYKSVYGIMSAESDDAKALEKAMIAACPDCSGAMHQATMSAVLYIAKHGWAKYVKAMSAP